MRVAILEDDAVSADHMARALKDSGHDVQTFPTGASLIGQLKRDSFDMLVLEWAPRDMSCAALLGWAREHLETVPPALFVVQRSDEADIVRTLNLGSEDYIVRPFRPAEFQARIRAFRRRHGSGPGADVQDFGDVRFDLVRQGVTMGDDEVVVTNKEFCLALLLFQNLDRPLSRAYLLDRIWGVSPDLQTRTLDAHVSRIRSKLRLRPEAGYRLAPVYSYGYRLERFADEPKIG